MVLYIVPVPIGNLGDITLRAIETLKSVDFIIAEDTRYSLKLLNHLGIRKKIVSYYKPREEEKSRQVLKWLETQTAALISDSGTPGISDPGYILIRKAIEKGIAIVPLPGPTAFVPVLAASGIDPGQFLFLGFPPRKKGELERFFKKISLLDYTLVFYESPRRAAAFLKTAAAVLGSRKFAVGKEISKKNEKIFRGDLANLEGIAAAESFLGEIAIIIGGCPKGRAPKDKSLRLNTLEDLFAYFKETHGISKNELKKILMKKSDSAA